MTEDDKDVLIAFLRAEAAELRKRLDLAHIAWSMQFDNQKMAWARAQELEKQRDELKAALERRGEQIFGNEGD